MATRGHFGIGIENGKNRANLGQLWRSAACFNADYMFTIGGRYQNTKADTIWRHTPFYEFEDVPSWLCGLPKDTRIIAVEVPDDTPWDESTPLAKFKHPERAMYVLGAEDHGISGDVLDVIDDLIYVPTSQCMNVAITGSIVLYDRASKMRAGF